LGNSIPTFAVITTSNPNRVRKKALLIFLSLNAFLTIPTVFAQDSLAHYNKNYLGFTTGTGAQYIGQLLGIGRKGFTVASNYYYHVNFYELQYYHVRPVGAAAI
jgi:hypothetical protein